MSRITRVLVLLVMAITTAACGGEETTETAGATTSPTSSTITTIPRPTTTSTGAASTTTSNGTEPPSELLVVGDWGSGTLPQGAVAGAMQRHAEAGEVSAILTTGDNFYGDDWEFLMEPFEWATESSIPFWVTWGNHDVESDIRIAAVNEAFDDPPRWTVHEWGVVDVIILDSTQITSQEQSRFFLEAMGDSNDPTIVTMHHPPYSCAHRASTTEVVDQIAAVFDDDVMLVLSGHEHVYQRFEHDGIAYVVSGGGGATIQDLSACPVDHPEPLAGESTFHFLALKQTPTAVRVTSIDVNGETIDEFDVPLP